MDAGEENLVFGKGRYWCKLFVGEKEICSVQGWNRIEVRQQQRKRLYGFSRPSDQQELRSAVQVTPSHSHTVVLIAGYW